MTPCRYQLLPRLFLLAVPLFAVLAVACGTVTGFDTPYNKGVHAYQDGHLPEAAEQFRIALDHDPTFYEAWYNLARTYDDLATLASHDGNEERVTHFTSRAEAAYQRCIEVRPDGARALVAFGGFKMDHGDFEGARALLLRAAEAEEDRAYPLTELGFFFQRQGRYDEAMTNYQKALDREPDNALTLYRLATWHEAKDELDTAQEFYERALDVEPNDAATWQSYGDLLVRTGQQRAAIAAYNQVLTLDPHGDGIARIHFQIGLLHQEMNRDELALPYFWDARRLAGDDDPELTDLISEALQRSYAALWRLESARRGGDETAAPTDESS